MNLVRQVLHWYRQQAAQRPQRIVVAVSGGADSTALAIALAGAIDSCGHGADASLLLAHYDHGLRSPDQHEADLAYVRCLARRVGAALMVGHAAAGAIRRAARDEGGVEAAARTARYRFLEAAARQTGAAIICTGHTRDDCVETVLMRLADGIDGVLLSGIPAIRDLGGGLIVARPLIGVTRAEVEGYVATIGERPRTDPSNLTDEHRRNRVRLQMLPAIRSVWPAVDRDLATLSRAMGAYRTCVCAEAAAVACETGAGRFRLDREMFYRIGADARLHLLYNEMVRAGLLSRSDRPGHRFFGPLLGPDPAGNRQLIGGRGITVELRGAWIVVGRAPSLPPET